jgi:hypothetical protein
MSRLPEEWRSIRSNDPAEAVITPGTRYSAEHVALAAFHRPCNFAASHVSGR